MATSTRTMNDAPRRSRRRHVLAEALVTGCLLSLVAACGSADSPSHNAIGGATGQPSATATYPPGDEPGPTSTPGFEATPTFIAGTVTPAVPYTPVAPTADMSTPDPSEPVHFAYSALIASQENAPAAYVAESQLIVLGRVIEILPARWTTPDGGRPANPRAALQSQEATIITPVVIELERPPLAVSAQVDLGGGHVVVAVDGGQVGDDSVSSDMPWTQFAVGERVIVALSEIGSLPGPQGIIPTEAGPGWRIAMKWTLTDDGQAVSFAGAHPADQLIADIEAAAQPGPTPTVLASPEP